MLRQIWAGTADEHEPSAQFLAQLILVSNGTPGKYRRIGFTRSAQSCPCYGSSASWCRWPHIPKLLVITTQQKLKPLDRGWHIGETLTLNMLNFWAAIYIISLTRRPSFSLKSTMLGLRFGSLARFLFIGLTSKSPQLWVVPLAYKPINRRHMDK